MGVHNNSHLVNCFKKYVHFFPRKFYARRQRKAYTVLVMSSREYNTYRVGLKLANHGKWV